MIIIMKDNLNFYYNLNISTIDEEEGITHFLLNNNHYYFVPLNRNPKELDDILKVSQELKNHGLLVHDLIANKMGNIITNIYNTNYILMHINGDIYDEITLPDILKLNKTFILNKTKSNLYRNNWSKLWSDKVDYFEYQISELGKDKEIILESFSYYIGLAENAISYVNSIPLRFKFTDQDKICLSHRRLNFPNYKLNYLNPLSFIFDLEVRDLAEYLKSAFFQNEDALNYLKLILKTTHFTPYSLSMLYARLLYPTYYFDIYEKIMNKQTSEENLLPIIEKNHEYELFLKNSYYEISKYAPLERIEWLLKKEL